MALGKVLIIEDDLYARAVFDLALPQEGIQYDMPQTREEILNSLLNNKYSLILFDTQLELGTFESDPVVDVLKLLLVAYEEFDKENKLDAFPICIPITKKSTDRETVRTRLLEYELPFSPIDIDKSDIKSVREFCAKFNNSGENYFK